MTVPANEPPANPPADPPTDPTPPPTPPPVPPTPNPTPTDDTNTRIGRLETLITSLTETVAKLIPSDDKPTARPWTHMGSKRRER